MSPTPLVQVRGVDVVTLEGRPLLRELSLQLGRERVAVVGRNGVGAASWWSPTTQRSSASSMTSS